MAVATSDLKLMQASTMASSFSTSTIGGAISATEVTGSSIGECFFTMAANSGSGGTKTQYAKLFYLNDHASSDLDGSVIYLKNSLDAVGSNGTVSVQSSSASDDGTKFCRVIGEDASGTAQNEDITCNGTSSASGALTFSKVFRVELRATTGGALTNAAGDITVTRSSALGIIPTGYSSATGEVDFFLESALDGSTTVADASTEPAGSPTWIRVNASGEGSAVANSGTLTAQSAQAIWFRWQVEQDANPSADISVVVDIYGDAS